MALLLCIALLAACAVTLDVLRTLDQRCGVIWCDPEAERAIQWWQHPWTWRPAVEA